MSPLDRTAHVPTIPPVSGSAPQHDDFHSTVRFETSRIHAVAMYCSDGRFGEQCDEFLQQGLGLPRYDRLAVPGGPACLAGHFNTYRQEDGLIEEIKFLVEVHELRRVVLIAHQGCAFYLSFLKVHEIDLLSRQCDDLVKAVAKVQSIDGRLKVEPYFALRSEDQVHFRALAQLQRDLAG